MNKNYIEAAYGITILSFLAIYLIFFTIYHMHSAAILLYIAIFLAIPSVIIMLAPIAKSFWNMKWGKWIIGLTALIIVEFSRLLSKHVIISITQTDPSNFPTAIRALTLLFGLINGLIFLLYGSLAFILILIFIDITYKHLPMNIALEMSSFIDETKHIANKLLKPWVYINYFLMQFSILIIVMYFYLNLNYFVTSPLTKLVLFLEYYKTNECINVQQGDWHTYLNTYNNDHISIASQDKATGNYNFYTTICKKKAKI